VRVVIVSRWYPGPADPLAGVFVEDQAPAPCGAGGGDGPVRGEGAEVRAARAEAILAVEMLVHTWDLAQATGQALPVSDEVSEHVLGLAREVISPRARERGSYGAEVPIGADAPALARLIAFSGRAAA